MYVDEIPKQYMVSKVWASITNMSYKRILIYQKEQQLITYLNLLIVQIFQLKYRKEFENLLDIVSNVFLTCFL